MTTEVKMHIIFSNAISRNLINYVEHSAGNIIWKDTYLGTLHKNNNCLKVDILKRWDIL